MKKVKINPNEWYSLQDIVRDRLIPWVVSFHRARKTVSADAEKSKLLKPLVTGTGRSTKYKFKGANIIKFVNQVEAGKVRL